MEKKNQEVQKARKRVLNIKNNIKTDKKNIFHKR